MPWISANDLECNCGPTTRRCGTEEYPLPSDHKIKNRNRQGPGVKKPLPEDVQPEAIHRSERAGGRFLRTINLPAEVESNKISAKYTDGLLRITLPKAEVAKPKKIKISMK